MKSTKRSEKAAALVQEVIASRKELEKWLNEIFVGADLNEEKYTNGILMTKILYILFPGIINIFEIKPPTTLDNKIKMWHYINDELLVQLGIRLHEWEVIKIARGTQNCVVGLLEKLLNFHKSETDFKPKYPPPAVPKWLKITSSDTKITTLEEGGDNSPVKPEAEKEEDKEVVIATSPSMAKMIIEYIRTADAESSLPVDEIIEQMEANATQNFETANVAFSLLSAYTFFK